ncbi:inosine-uridine preferring nucleoside hydrolase-like [Antedon mediterranea]|uniref:inosine-uridine preferring nucleoside hydrolase-like n=1 Tax=Antedon mediterranea TaxID=105859 RepID=UPI003AF6A4AA
MEGKLKLIIDCDVGVDDALAIMLALATPHVELQAVSCVAGNVDVNKVCINALKVLDVCNQLQVPVYKGCTTGLLGERLRATFYHGIDGLGDAKNIDQPDINLIKKEVAAIALVRMVNERPGEISIAAIGPLTNIAIAMKLDPHFTEKVKEIVIMGGELEGRASNLTTEFNFTCDPEAVHIVLGESQCPVTIVPFEVTRRHAFTDEFLEDLLSRETRKAMFVKSITANSIEVDRRKNHLYTPCDLYAVAYLVDQSCVTKMERVHVQVELHGSLTRGKMIPDWNGKILKKHDISIIMSMDMEKLRKLFSAVM